MRKEITETGYNGTYAGTIRVVFDHLGKADCFLVSGRAAGLLVGQKESSDLTKAPEIADEIEAAVRKRLRGLADEKSPENVHDLLKSRGYE